MQRIQCLREAFLGGWQRGSCISLHALSTWAPEVQKARSIPDREGKGGGSEKHGDRPCRQNRKFLLKRKCFNAILKTFCSEPPCSCREVKEKQLSADSAVWSSHAATHRLLSLSLYEQLERGTRLPRSNLNTDTSFHVCRLLVSFQMVSRSRWGMLIILQ